MNTQPVVTRGWKGLKELLKCVFVHCDTVAYKNNNIH